MTDIKLGRAERRRLEKAKKHKPARQDKTSINPVIDAVLHADFKEKFTNAKIDADTQCIASDNTQAIVLSVGFLLYVVLKALQIDKLEIEEEEIKQHLDLMANELGKIQDEQTISQEQRKVLIDGMDYLDALTDVLTKESIAVAWWTVEKATGKIK